jgi:hypothetical protein
LALLLFLGCVTTSLFASGVGVLDASNAVSLRLDSSYVRVTVEGQISFDPPVVSEVYPDSLQNLYKKKQMIVAARYQHAQAVHITLIGTAYDQPVSYS